MSSDQIAWIMLIGLIGLIVITILWVFINNFRTSRSPYMQAQNVIQNALKQTQPVEALIPLLTSNEHWIRLQAATALGELRDKRAVEPLIAALADEDSNSLVCRSVVAALGEIGDERAVGPLVSILTGKHRHSNHLEMEAARWLHRLRWQPANEAQLKTFMDTLTVYKPHFSVQRRSATQVIRNANYYHAEAHKMLDDLIIIYFTEVQGNSISYQAALGKLTNAMSQADVWIENYATDKNVSSDGAVIRWQEVRTAETNEDRSVFDSLWEYEIRRISEDEYRIHNRRLK